MNHLDLASHNCICKAMSSEEVCAEHLVDQVLIVLVLSEETLSGLTVGAVLVLLAETDDQSRAEVVLHVEQVVVDDAVLWHESLSRRWVVNEGCDDDEDDGSHDEGEGLAVALVSSDRTELALEVVLLLFVLLAGFLERLLHHFPLQSWLRTGFFVGCFRHCLR